MRKQYKIAIDDALFDMLVRIKEHRGISLSDALNLILQASKLNIEKDMSNILSKEDLEK